MSWTRFLETGSGGIALRIEIEGLAIQPVSEAAMEQTIADGRRRVCCLPPMGAGFVIEERVNIPEATFEVQGNQLQLEETAAQDLSQIFNATPSFVGHLSRSIDTSTSTLDLLTSTGLAVGDVLHVGTEAMHITAISGNAVAVTRAYWGTIAQAHYSVDPATGGRYLQVTSMPARVRGRRVRAFAYGDGDDPAGSGTQVWLGRANGDPMCSQNGLIWMMQVESVAASLRAKLGTELDKAMAVRGAYYNWEAPLAFTIIEKTATETHRVSNGLLFGFYETNASFCSALTGALASACAAATGGAVISTFDAVELDDGTWTVRAAVGSGVVSLRLWLLSDVDGGTGPTPEWRDASGLQYAFDDVNAGSAYTITWAISGPEGARQIPRGVWGAGSANEDRVDSTRSDVSRATDLPATRLYPSRPVSSDWTGLRVHFASLDIGISGEITEVSADDGWVTLRNSAAIAFAGTALYTPAKPVELKAGRTIAVGSGGAVGATMNDLRTALLRDGPIYGNRGTAPFLGSGAFPDLGDWDTAATRGARGIAWLAQRLYTVFAEVELSEYLAHHWRALGCYPVLDDNGRIALKFFETPNITTAVVDEIDDEIVDDEPPALEPDAQGSINTVILKTNYDPVEDKHADTGVITITDAGAYEEDHESRPIEIAPKSRAAGPDTLTPAQAELLAIPLLGYFGAPYKQVSISVSWKLFAVHCGDVVLVNSNYLPAFSGLRPMTDVVGIVVGRRWMFGEASGRLTILVTTQNVSGYAPSAEVAAHTDLGGNKWNITITTGLYAPEGTNEDEYFFADDVVEVVQRDTTSPTVVRGTIVSVDITTHVIQVQFDSAWAPGANSWELEYASYASTVTAQKLYCFIAGADARINSTTLARTFAP